MENNKKVSIIVPIYNVERYLEDCVKSLEEQTYKNIEIILIDDGSKDNSLHIAKRLKEKYENIKVFSQKNNGQGSARNTGIKNATGEYISFVDSDDIIDKNMINVMLKTALNNDLDIVECHYQEFTDDSKGYIYGSKVDDNIIYKGKEYYENIPILSPCNKLYKVDFLKQIDFKFTENRFAEDAYDISYIILKSKKIMQIEECLYFYRRDNLNSTRNDVNIEHKLKLGIDKLFIANKLNKLKNAEKINGYISNIIIRNIFGVIFNKYYFTNKKYRVEIRKNIKKYNIKNIILININLKIIISLISIYFRKKFLKKD